jgi:integrase
MLPRSKLTAIGDDMATSLNFTDATIRKLLTPLSGRDEYKDEGGDRCVRGLYLRVSATGNKSFSVVRRVAGGKPIRATLDGSFGSPWNVENARREALRILSECVAAKDPTEAKRQIKGELSLQELCDLYLVDRAKAGKRTVDAIRSKFEVYLGKIPDLPAKKHGRKREKGKGSVDWSATKVSQITSHDVRTLHANISALVSPTTANRVIQDLRAIYGFGIKQMGLANNPAETVTLAPEKQRTRHLEGDELRAFMDALAETEQPWQDFFTALLYIGYRREAVSSMQWSDLEDIDNDSFAGVWRVRGEKAKNGDPISLPIVGRALAVIKRRYKERSNSSDYVFEGEGRNGYITSPEKAWNKLIARAGIENLHLHDLRHTLASMMINNDVDLHSIGKMLGHKDIKSTNRYAHMVVGTIGNAVSIAHDAIEAVVNKSKVTK